jgi:hypothetical protein
MSDDELSKTEEPLADEEKLWVRRVEAQFPEQARQSDPARLTRLVRTYLRLREPLDIEQDKDLLRFLGLALLITPEQRRSPLFQGVTRRILAAPDWDATKKLDFLFKHVVGRRVSPEEPDFGPNFVPSTPILPSE